MFQGAAERDEIAEGESPFDERREADRYTITFKLSVFVDAPGGGGPVVSSASAWNISRLGALIETRQPLAPSQSVTIAIPTDQRPEDMRMPEAFVGGATVARVGRTGRGKYLAGLRFGELLTRNPEFTMYTEFLHSTALTNWLLTQ